MDTGGYIPVKVVDRSTPYVLSAIAELRDSFKQDEEVDKAALASLANIIKNEPQDYTKEEEAVVRDGKEFYGKCMTSKKFKNLKISDPKVKMKAVHLDGESLVIAMCEAVIDASLAECVAYEFIKDSRQRQAKLGKKYKAIETKKQNSHSQLYLNRRSLGTKVIFASKVDIKGSVPSFVMDRLSTGYASNMIELQKKFDKSKEIDTFKRQQIIAKFEEIAIEGAPGIESHFDEIEGAQEISSGLTGQTLMKAEKRMGWGKTSITVRASHKEVAAFFWGLKSRVESQLVVHRVNNKTLVITVEHEGHLTAVRFSEAGQKEAGQTKTDVELMTRNKGLGKAASKKSAIKHLSMATDAAYYFDNLLKSTEAGEQDGRRFGEQLMERVKKKNVRDSKVVIVREFIAANRALREIAEQHGFMRTMLCAVVMNKFKRRATNEGEVKSEEEARGWEIGSAMTAVMLSTATAAHAVDEWAHQFTEVQEIMNEQEWLRPMLEETVMKLFMKSTIGLKARVTVGAATSMLDLLMLTGLQREKSERLDKQ
ncbi:hypothetical protein TrCOL_g5186 [Triparma columacea]|uniref:Uncharacterized protein n=1 Tax=Triparma columacea TaxID=722753 RepID=A0A9W7LEX8_9STRA|nr:hypothetical protein TrCOL_g5186 [Triparma columacea]